MIVAVLASHILPSLGVIYISTIVWKVARKYSVTRWFF